MNRTRFLRRCLSLGQLALISGLCAQVSSLAARAEAPGLDAPQRETLRRYARDTWRSFEAMTRGLALPSDKLHRDRHGQWVTTPLTTPTNIGAYLWSIVAAEKLGIISAEEGLRRTERMLTALGRVKRIRGLYHDRLHPGTGEPLTVYPNERTPVRPRLSAVDNGWLAVALMIVANTRPELRERAQSLLQPMDFRLLYEPFSSAAPQKHPGQLHGSLRLDDGTLGTLLGLINTETRIASYVGIARGQLPPEHYYRMFRTFPPEADWQRQIPRGEIREYLGIDVFQGHYRYRGMRIVPSWGGSMFEALMVPLFIPEDRWAPGSWGVNHPLYARAQMEHGLYEARYGFWGFSPSCRPHGGYRNYGVDALATNPTGYCSNDRDVPAGSGASPNDFTDGVVTPHASFLALRYLPREAMDNLKALEARFPIYGEFGFFDSVNVSSGVVSECVLALDQGMIMAAIANALCEDLLQHAFSDGAIEKSLRPLIAPEEFTAGEDRPASAGQAGKDRTPPASR
jgi:hypothetical protein